GAGTAAGQAEGDGPAPAAGREDAREAPRPEAGADPEADAAGADTGAAHGRLGPLSVRGLLRGLPPERREDALRDEDAPARRRPPGEHHAEAGLLPGARPPGCPGRCRDHPRPGDRPPDDQAVGERRATPAISGRSIFG